MKKKILILVGKGKSTICDFFIDENNYSCPDNLLKSFGLHSIDRNFIYYDGIPKKDEFVIIKKLINNKKVRVERKYQTPVYTDFSNKKFVIHLQSEEDIDKIPLYIKEIALIFKLSIK